MRIDPLHVREISEQLDWTVVLERDLDGNRSGHRVGLHLRATLHGGFGVLADFAPARPPA